MNKDTRYRLKQTKKFLRQLRTKKQTEYIEDNIKRLRAIKKELEKILGEGENDSGD